MFLDAGRYRKVARRKHRYRKRTHIVVSATCSWAREDNFALSDICTGARKSIHVLFLAPYVLGRGKTMLVPKVWPGVLHSLAVAPDWVYYSVVVNILITDLTTVINFEHRNNQCATFSEHSSVRTRFPTRSVSVLKESFSSVPKNRKS